MVGRASTSEMYFNMPMKTGYIIFNSPLQLQKYARCDCREISGTETLNILPVSSSKTKNNAKRMNVVITKMQHPQLHPEWQWQAAMNPH
jgi:hypothetical protein